MSAQSMRGQPVAADPHAALRVSVVIPCYNASSTLERTLIAVRAQTLSAIEIVVVDDGSTDDSIEIVHRHAADDPRIRLLRQQNAGVAAARNHGAAQSRAPFLAFVDADDIWTADKLERQIACFDNGPPQLGLVYCWFCRIDADDTITGYDSAAVAEGDVLPYLCARNLVGNGSSVLVRREAFDRAGGFDPELRAQNAEGCEDYDFYAKVAGEWEFALVRDFLTGYRVTDNNMSSNLVRMVRSRVICSARLLERHPQYRDQIRHGRRRFVRGSLRRAVQLRRWQDVRLISAMMLKLEPFANLIELPGILMRATQTRRLIAQAEALDSGVRFKIAAPSKPLQPGRRNKK